MASLSVSVAMATYNGAAYLARQLDDLAAQSILPAELVVCDDGSTDDTLAILERFAITAPFAVHVHRNSERLGYRANFLKCASLCRSDLIAFCDQDDRWASTKIATMLACFEDPEVLLAFHDAEIIAEDERSLGRLMRARPIGRSPPLSGSPWTFSLGFTQVFRRWLCDCDRLWPLSVDPNSAREPMAHDQWYFFLASVLGTVINIEAPLVRYRQHGDNVFGWAKAKRTLGARLLGKDSIRHMAATTAGFNRPRRARSFSIRQRTYFRRPMPSEPATAPLFTDAWLTGAPSAPRSTPDPRSFIAPGPLPLW